jgi:DNA-binding MurR/RpiR family transcriptional regulator
MAGFAHLHVASGYSERYGAAHPEHLVLRAAERAKEGGVSVWSITGPGPNELTIRSDEAITVRAPSTAAVQAIHLIAIHGLCAVVDSVLGARARTHRLPRQTADLHPIAAGPERIR